MLGRGGGGKSLVRIFLGIKTLKISTIQPCQHKLLLSVKSKGQKILTIRPTFSSHSWNWNCMALAIKGNHLVSCMLCREYITNCWINIVHHRSIRTWIHQCTLLKMCTHHWPIVIDINFFSTTASGEQCCRWWHTTVVPVFSGHPSFPAKVSLHYRCPLIRGVQIYNKTWREFWQTCQHYVHVQI